MIIKGNLFSVYEEFVSTYLDFGYLKYIDLTRFFMVNIETF